MKKNKTFKVALVDDHVLIRKALRNLIDSFEQFEVMHESSDGRELQDWFRAGKIPDVVLLDLNMPHMNGYDTAEWLQARHPEVHILILTMYDSELALIRLLQLGVKGFMKKDVTPDELHTGLLTVVDSGTYYSGRTAGKLANLVRLHALNRQAVESHYLTSEELRFLEFVCSDMTYKEIAQKMSLSPRSVDVLRDQLFFKLDVKSRVGLVLLAVRNGVVTD